MFNVLGIEKLAGKKDVTKVYYKVYLGEPIDSSKGDGYKVRDFFLTYNPDVVVGDSVNIVYGIGFDSKPYIKGFERV